MRLRARINYRGWRIAPRAFVDIRWRHWVPFLVVHVRFERALKWILRGIVAAGVGTSVIAFTHWYFSLALALLLVGVEQYFERTTVTTATLFVQPMPAFDVDPKQWVGLGVGIPQPIGGHELLNVLGPAFRSGAYARSVFDLLHTWSGAANDLDDHVRLAFVLEPDGTYTVLIYPSLDRPAVVKADQVAKLRGRLEQPDKEHHLHVTQLIFAKNIPGGAGSQLQRFLQAQRPDRPFWLHAFVQPENGTLGLAFEIEPILKHHFRVTRRQDLTRKDIEWSVGPFGEER